MSASRGISLGTVAARIRALQDPRVSPEHIPVRPSRVINHLFEPDVLVSYGRRNQDSFASPAERTARDTTDGSKCDGRPPAASTDLDLQSSPTRAATACCQPTLQLAELGLDDPFIASNDGPKSPRRARSQDSLESPRPELEGARARLRPVSARRQHLPRRSQDDVSSTLAELGVMIDTALDEHRSDNTPAQSPVGVSRPPSAQSTRQETSSRSVDRPQVQDRLFTRYRSQDPARMAQPVRSPARDPLPLSLSGLLPSPRPLSPESGYRRQLPHTDPTAAVERPSSPVRERAAIFENLAACRDEISPPQSPPPRAHLHEKDGWSIIPHHYPSTEEEARMHRAKFGRSISERVPAAKIESSEDTQDTYDTAHQTIESNLPSRPSPSRSESRRAPSRGWPAQVRTSSKTGVSHPQPFHEAASPDRKDAHHPPVRPSIVSQRIAQLALAGLEDLHKPQSRTTSATAIDSACGKIKAVELQAHNMDGGLLLPNQMASLKVSAQEEADDLFLIPGSFKSAGAVRIKRRGLSQGHDGTPMCKSRLERQIISGFRPAMERDESGSPASPVRGRSVMDREACHSGYGVEQSFYFSPRKSRSPSRGSGRRLTLQINMGTPDRQSMEKVVIKADMDVLDEA